MLKSLSLLILSSFAAQAALVAHYQLNETSGGIADISGNNYTGNKASNGSGQVYSQSTVTAGTYGSITVTAAQATNFGTSIDFGVDNSNFGNFTLNNAGTTAVGNLLSTGTGGNSIDGTMTVMAWVNLDSTSGVQSIFSSNQGGGGDGWRFGTNGNQVRFTTLGSQDFNQGGANLTTNTWNHLAVTVDNDTITFYLNGNVLGSQNASVAYKNEETGFEVKVGGKATGSENMFGRLDEVKIFDTALSQSEIIAAAVPEPSSTSLLGLAGLALILRRKK
ncbi:LamG domain-containing protein [Rubritalea tangerina]|uniref:LamG domain-containing protein n=1 Tax=Rubritalea tangerina TaxID=430798 RepID=A0ABW4ZEH8_9BACT